MQAAWPCALWRAWTVELCVCLSGELHVVHGVQMLVATGHQLSACVCVCVPRALAAPQRRLLPPSSPIAGCAAANAAGAGCAHPLEVGAWVGGQAGGHAACRRRKMCLMLLPAAACCCHCAVVPWRRSVGQRLLLPSAGVAASVVLSALGALNSKRGRSKEGQLGGALDSEKPIPWQRRGNCCWAVLWGQR